MSLEDYSFGGLRPLLRRFVRLSSGDSSDSFHLVVAHLADGHRLACGRQAPTSQIAEELFSADDPTPFCAICRHEQARLI
jgi:hypothetical protein